MSLELLKVAANKLLAIEDFLWQEVIAGKCEDHWRSEEISSTKFWVSLSAHVQYNPIDFYRVRKQIILPAP